MNIQRTIQLSLVATALGVVLLATALLFVFVRNKLENDLGYDLLKVAMLTAPQISGDQHQAIRNNADSAGEEFQRIRGQLLRVRQMLDLPAEQIYTIRPASTTEMEFVVMTQANPFIGDRLARNPTMERVLANGRADFTAIYSTITGRWISAFAPIKNERSETVGLLEVDFPYDKFQAEFYRSMWPVALGALFLLLILFGASSWIAHRVSRPLRGIAESVKPFAEGRGDLTMQLAVPGDDEIAAVAGNIDRFLSSIAQTIREVKQFSAVVLNSSEEFRTAAADVDANGSRSAAMIETTGSANQELVASLQKISHNVNQQNELIGGARPTLERLLKFIIHTEESAGEMTAELNRAAQELHAGRDTLESLSEHIDRIRDSSEQIEAVVEIVQGIADRIAMLALNASIEAARAGEYGRGFAVVADEVSKLSEGTSRQIQDISRIAAVNRQEAEAAVRVAEESQSMYAALFDVLLNSQSHADRNQSAAAGERGAAKTSLSSLESLASFSESNARSVQEQLNGTREVESSLEELGESGEQLVRLTARINATAERLQGEVENLDRLLDRLIV